MGGTVFYNMEGRGRRGEGEAIKLPVTEMRGFELPVTDIRGFGVCQ
jgi:hypothetical protein